MIVYNVRYTHQERRDNRYGKRTTTTDPRVLQLPSDRQYLYDENLSEGNTCRGKPGVCHSSVVPVGAYVRKTEQRTSRFAPILRSSSLSLP